MGKNVKANYNPAIHQRQSIRLPGYDYSQAGAYFITICTHNRKCLFGAIENTEMILNDAGRMVEKWYRELANKFPGIQCVDHIVMPNHIHFIIQNVGVDGDGGIVGADLRVCPVPMGSGEDGQKGEHTAQGEHIGSPLQKIIQWFKTMSTNEYIRNVKNNHWQSFDGKLWQRNYYEHIIRNDDELNLIREYIINNPINWQNDKNNLVGAPPCGCPKSCQCSDYESLEKYS
jgi:putative transposase